MAQMKKTQIIKEIIGFYERNPLLRATTSYGYCIYYGIHYIAKKVVKCAVGRCLINPKKKQQESDQCPTGSTCSLVWGTIEKLDKDLKVKYRGHSLEFWTDLQRLHDNSRYWDANGLTASGKKAKKRLLQKYKE